ncbi:MAG: ATP-binding cassette domain-containing protein [Silicimonas sp.]|nr:ATP-binding cassette domain-containing protein [Silicimonas sp.]
MISVSDLSYGYRDTPILTDITLEIPKGGVTALIGPNGAGKSTLLSLIARLMPLQSGRIMVDELKIGTCASTDLAQRLSILPQVPEIAARLTVAELVAFGRYPYHKGRPGAEDLAQVETAIEVFDLQALAHRSLDTLSGGQRQRALLAMIYAQDTDYMLLDEPLNNLDIAASRALMQLLRQMAETHGRTIVIVLHDINYAAAYADHIVTMKEGHLGPCGAPRDIVTDALLRDVFQTDAKVRRLDGKMLIDV